MFQIRGSPPEIITKSIEELIDSVDVVDIVTPTISHYQIAMMAINKGKHIFIEKPIAHNVEEAEELVKFSKERKIIGNGVRSFRIECKKFQEIKKNGGSWPPFDHQQ